MIKKNHISRIKEDFYPSNARIIRLTITSETSVSRFAIALKIGGGKTSASASILTWFRLAQVNF